MSYLQALYLCNLCIFLCNLLIAVNRNQVSLAIAFSKLGVQADAMTANVMVCKFSCVRVYTVASNLQIFKFSRILLHWKLVPTLQG